jgi:hypothetical protein
MAVTYIVNAPSSVSWLWSVAKSFLDESTIKKIRLSRHVPTDVLLGHVNPAQLEERYGGTAANVEVFWPPIVPHNKFALPSEDPEACLSHASSYSEYFSQHQPSTMAAAPHSEIAPEIRIKCRNKHQNTSKVAPYESVRVSDSPEAKPKYVSDKEFADAFTKHFIDDKGIMTVAEQRRVSFTVDVEQIVYDEEGSDDHSCVDRLRQDSNEGETRRWWCGKCRLSSLKCNLL